ncbi:MAG: hypothetical protein MUO72_01255 [Bacteroidales bacterium]|nr:hypothetical protein [Bacteroidales bacterium]
MDIPDLVIFISSAERIVEKEMPSGRKFVTHSLPAGSQASPVKAQNPQIIDLVHKPDILTTFGRSD